MGETIYKTLDEVASIEFGTRVVKSKVAGTQYPVYGGGGETFRIDSYNRENRVVVGRFALSKQCTRFVSGKFFLNDSGLTVKTKDETVLIQDLLDKLILYSNDLIYNLARGAGQKNLNINDFKELKISFPLNIEEQQRIVKILDKAEEIRIKKKLANEKLDEFLKSTFIDMFGDPEFNNKNWEKVVIRDVVKDVKYGTSSKAGLTGTYPILRMGNLTYNGAIVLDDLKYIDLKESEIDKYTVHKGDILFNRTNSKELVGKTAVYRGTNTVAFAGYLVRVRTNNLAHYEFLSAFMNSSYMKKKLQMKCKNIVGMANINAQEFQDFDIYLPPIDLQNQFAQIVQKVEAQKEKNQKVIEQMDNLFNSLMQQAFNGEL
ncbi:TPA: restriction endonuclease subunit S [Candidatus Galligastranaerophilus intestinavium]|uniref:Restriction endonuclease subunit S n=1 Tax=Candidatus Galligastranaerophilus intestinavium TaxID=2840836 RepID=A0A9D1FH52_9BACT|nr:restriction endonuclease subunit S [Candidatus Galligastranaerophilus intestinavium]